MRYTVAFRLQGALADAVAVEWTDVAAPQGSNAGWEACVRLPNGDWRFADHDATAPANWRDAGPFGNIGLRYRLSPSGPWSPISATRKEIVLGDGGAEPEEPPATEQPAALTAGQWSVHGVAPDPAAPDDPRRAAVIAVPTSSPAHASDNVRWQVNGDEPADVFARAMTLLTTAGPNGEKLWRTTSAVAATDPACPHLRAPGTKFAGLRLFYTIDGVRSHPSATARDIAVPALPVDPKPDPDPEPNPDDDWKYVDVTPSNHLTRFAAARTGKTRYRMAAGVYDDFYWPSNVTDHDIEIIPLDRRNPPTIRAMRIGAPGNLDKGNFAHLKSAAKGTNFNKRIKLDGLNFIAQRFTGCDGLNGFVSFVSGAHAMPDAANEGGLGWRVYRVIPAHPSGDLVGGKENGGYAGLQFYTTGATVEVCNCLFDGYSIQLGWYASGGSCDIHHNEFRNLAEDGIKWDYSNGKLTIRDNHIGPMRGPTDGIATASGGPNPPHPDAFQAMSSWDNLHILRNAIVDFTALNGGQIKKAQGSAACWGLRLENNELRSPSATAFWLDNFTRKGDGVDGTGYDIIIRGNKCWSGGLPWDKTVAALGATSLDWSNARVLADNNVAAKFWLGGATSNVTYTRNVEDNSKGVWPVGWKEVARDRVEPGQPFSGRYGATAGVMPT